MGSSSSATAAETQSGSEAASETRGAPTTASAAPTDGRHELCQKDIFEILKGGAEKADPSLVDHLWRMAGNLACRDWTPPSVTVQVVVADMSVHSR